MGATKRSYANELRDELKLRLGRDLWSKIHFESIYYQHLLQEQQRKVFARMVRQELDWTSARKFLLFGFSDAAAMEHKSHYPNSIYVQTQQVILNALDRTYDALGAFGRPVVIIAQSLGALVVSNASKRYLFCRIELFLQLPG